MKVTEIRKIYDNEAEYYRQDPNRIDSDVWRDVLGNYEESEVRRAITMHHADVESVEWFGTSKPRGSIFPKASDIKAIIEGSKRRERELQEKGPAKFNACEQTRFSVDVNGTSWPELRCFGGQLYLRTTTSIRHPQTRTVLQEDSALRSMRNCDCWLDYKRQKGIA